jgi:hypothetical protein
LSLRSERFAGYSLQFFRHDPRFHHPFFRGVATGRCVRLESFSERKVSRSAAFNAASAFANPQINRFVHFHSDGEAA